MKKNRAKRDYIKIICERLYAAVKESRNRNFYDFPLDYLKEITSDAERNLKYFK